MFNPIAVTQRALDMSKDLDRPVAILCNKTEGTVTFVDSEELDKTITPADVVLAFAFHDYLGRGDIAPSTGDFKMEGGE